MLKIGSLMFHSIGMFPGQRTERGPSDSLGRRSQRGSLGRPPCTAFSVLNRNINFTRMSKDFAKETFFGKNCVVLEGDGGAAAGDDGVPVLGRVAVGDTICTVGV